MMNMYVSFEGFLLIRRKRRHKLAVSGMKGRMSLYTHSHLKNTLWTTLWPYVCNLDEIDNYIERHNT